MGRNNGHRQRKEKVRNLDQEAREMGGDKKPGAKPEFPSQSKFARVHEAWLNKKKKGPGFDKSWKDLI